MVVHQAGAHTALLSHLYAVLVAQLVNLSHKLLYLLHDGLVLLLILLLGGIILLLLLLRLLIAGRIVGGLLGCLFVLGPGVGDLIATDGAATAALSLTSSLFQFPLKFIS